MTKGKYYSIAVSSAEETLILFPMSSSSRAGSSNLACMILLAPLVRSEQLHCFERSLAVPGSAAIAGAGRLWNKVALIGKCSIPAIMAASSCVLLMIVSSTEVGRCLQLKCQARASKYIRRGLKNVGIREVAKSGENTHFVRTLVRVLTGHVRKSTGHVRVQFFQPPKYVQSTYFGRILLFCPNAQEPAFFL